MSTVLIIGGAVLIALSHRLKGTPIAIITGALFIVLGVTVGTLETILQGLPL